MSTNPHTDEITLGQMKASYECGNIRGKHDAEKHARIAAFGAIRRAAAEARWYDNVAKGTDWLTPEYIEDCKESARAVRYAIRAAIGSDKA